MFTQLLLFFLLQLSSLVLGQIPCSTAGSTRITTSSTSTSPSSSSNGRVEYCFNAGSGNRWTPICLESWNLNAAHVACRSTSSSTRARSSAVNTVPGNDYVSGVANVLTLTCTGLESVLSQCNPQLVSTSNQTPVCNGRQTAGVTCRTSPSINSIVLVGGSSDLNGFVQIYDGTQWLFLSTSSPYWTTHHAQVACNQLGYVGGTVPDLGPEPAGMPGPFTFVCPPNARGLPDCIDDATVFPTNTFLATLSCSANGQSDFALRLVRSTRSNAADSGVLEVSYQGRYGTICSTGWSSTEATVACKNLGFPRSSTRTSSSESVFDSKPSWIGGIDCSSADLTSISSCTRDTILGERCSSAAHVTCDSSVEFPDAAIAGIVVPCVLLLIAFVLILIYHRQIKAKFLVYKRQHCPTWDLNCGCVRSRMARVNPNRRQQSGRPPVTLATSSETNRTERLVVTPVVATATNQTSVRRASSSSSSSSDSEVERSNSRQQQQQQQQQQQRQEPHNPEFSSGAPPSYNVAGTFAQVDELGEKPPPYIPPVPVEPTAPAAPPPPTNFGGYPLPTGPPAAPSMLDSAYPPPPSSNAAYPPPPSSNAAYPPPPSSNAAYPPPSFPNYN